MILLYSTLMLLLGGMKLLVGARAAALSRRYSKLVLAVQTLLRSASVKPGNGKNDLCETARQQYELGVLVRKRDLIEARYFAWQRSAERLGRWVNKLRMWKGQKLPYTMGAVDVWLLLGLVDHLGVARYLNADRLLALVLTALGI